MTTSIAGIGQTEFSVRSGRSELQLAIEAIKAAVADAGIDIDEIDGLVRYTWDNTTEAAILNALGLPRLTYYGETEFGGVNCCGAIAQACAAIEAGLASCIVFYRALNARSGTRYGRGDRILSEENGQLVNRQMEPPGDVYSAPFGLLVPGQHHALYARAYLDHYGLSDDQCAEMLGSIAVTQRAYANANPRALLRERELTMEQYLAGRIISEPLRLYDYCLETDGAMAIVITSKEKAKSLRSRTVDVLAAQQYVHPGSVPMFLYAEDTHRLVPPEAGEILFRRAGVSAQEIDVAMFYDATSIMVPMALEDFGFVERGGAHDFLTSGGNGPGGRLPINTHGGLLSEGYFHGLNSIAEAVRQLRGESPNQVDCETAFMTLRGASSMILGRA
ncbi:thiolase C-terminal domain-containing protein [Novosphingobium profundi]|uniref:thiolase C-terminal domain-containing protein n=1 Tax=Novosphingobium profundi TaxID=1774954 RepID=UPI001CFC82A5|nr:lipid-transfer protein [Novosphingobium profundi]